MACFRSLGVAALLLSFSFAPAWAQRLPPPPGPSAADERAQADLELQHKQQRERQKKRFEEMKRDSQKLLELATELKQSMDKSGENVLSLDVLRKAEEMEKLARKLKNNMRGE